jgi:hypothetical protein
MNKIPCDVCLDLIPLVKDNVASQASKKLVEEHIEQCEECKEIYNSFENEEIMMNDINIIKKIKKQIFIFSLIIIVIASMVGLALSESMGMFYNILIMPAIGILGYFILKNKSYFVPVSLFTFSYIWLFVKYIGEGMMLSDGLITIITIPIYWSLIYAGLCGVGLVIGFLLKYAFGKENNYGKQKKED